MTEPLVEIRAPGGHGAIMTKEEMLRFLEFMEEIEIEAEHVLPRRAVDPFYRMMIYLMRQHLDSRMVTVSSLAAASSVPYATAMRRIEEMCAQGLIVRRPRTRTGKTFSLHPSPAMIQAWYDYARRIKRVIGTTFGLDGEVAKTQEYFFGASYLSARIIPPPSIGSEPLSMVPPLRLLVHADPTFLAMHNLKRELEQLLDISIHDRSLSIDRLREEGLSNARRGRSHYDIITANVPWVGEFAEQGVLRPLDDLIASSGRNVSDFHPAGWHGCQWKGRQYGVPMQTTPELLFFREDLFEQEGLAPPETTEQVLAAARRLHRPRRGLRGIAWNAARGTPIGHTFIQVLAAFGRPIVDLRATVDGFDVRTIEGEQYRPMIDSPEARSTAEYLLELLHFSPLNILSMAWHERIAAYSRGEVAMCYGWSQRAPYFELDPDSPAHQRTGFLPHPRGGAAGRNIATVGGYMLGIPANLPPERLQATWRVLQFLTSSEAIKLYVLRGTLVSPRFSVSADPEVFSLSKVIGAVDEMARIGQLQLWPRPPIPEITAIISICGEEIHDMCRGLKSAEVALADAQNRADRLMRSHGHY